MAMRVAPPPSGRLWETGRWFDVRDARRGDYSDAIASLRTNGYLEFLVYDSENRPRGACLVEIIGQTLQPGSGLPVVHLAVLAAEQQEVFG